MAEQRHGRLKRNIADEINEINEIIGAVAGDSPYTPAEIENLRSGEGRTELVDAGGVSRGLWPFVHRHLPVEPPSRRVRAVWWNNV